MGEKESLQEFWEKVEGIRVCMLSTIDDSMIRARPMTIIQKEFEGKLWFIADSSSATVREIELNSKVNITFVNSDKKVYASLSGLATVNRDPKKKQEMENFITNAWFSNGETGEPELLEIDIDFGEYWQTTKGMFGQVIELGLASVSDHRPDLGENKKIASH